MKRVGALVGIALIGLGAGLTALERLGPADAASTGTTRPCTKVGLVGDSKSDYRIGARLTIEHELVAHGLPYYMTTSGGRSIRQAGGGTDRWTGDGLQSAALAKAAGADCFLIALGGNDAAFTHGDRRLMAADIDAMLRTIGPEHRVDWITSSSRLAAGPFSDRNIRKFSQELDRAARTWPNLDVNHWERVPESAPGWWSPDGLHLRSGNAARGRYVVDSLFIDGSR
ncbi:MAG: hypothetical protein QM774_13655 [Gordonia sp. (in: high G+C Gram-positive bacteria)]|uniref:hypothetical protein n=1 Tax=Gordonia sp. (in: high G+C Gram-positive bacteria) TaxID=84139 RepID=UPI0039E2E473